MKKLFFGLVATIMLSVTGNAQDIKDYNNQLESFKTQIKSTEKGVIISIDNEQPRELGNYLSQIGKENIEINTVSHIELDTKSENGVLDIYSIQYSSDFSKYLIVIENKNDVTQSNIVDASFDFSNKSIKLLSHTEYLVNTNQLGKQGWSKCFGKCLTAGLSTEGLLGQVITLGGAFSVVCLPCGYVAATYVAVLALGCAGGCVGH